MTAINEEEAINSEEIIEENKKEETETPKEEVVEKKAPVIPAKYTRPPAFEKSGNMG